MNIHTPEIDRLPTREEAAAALALLRQWAGKSSDEEISGLDSAVGWLVPGQGHPALSRVYPAGFRPDAQYRATMPDLQNGPESLIRGAKSRIQHVGISNFRLPIRFATRDGLHGQAVDLSDGSTGIAQGVAANGALLVRTAQGPLRSVFSEEISVRPRAAG